MEDLYQLGRCLGFLKAVRGFDPAWLSASSPPTTWVPRNCQGRIRRFLPGRRGGEGEPETGRKAGEAIRSAREAAPVLRPPGQGATLSRLAEGRPDWSRRIAAAEANLQWPPSRWGDGDSFTLEEAMLGTGAWRRPSWAGRPCGQEEQPPCPTGTAGHPAALLPGYDPGSDPPRCWESPRCRSPSRTQGRGAPARRKLQMREKTCPLSPIGTSCAL